MKKCLYVRKLLLLAPLLTFNGVFAMEWLGNNVGKIFDGVDANNWADKLNDIANSRMARAIGDMGRGIADTANDIARSAARAKENAARLAAEQKAAKLAEQKRLQDLLENRGTTEAMKLRIMDQLASIQRGLEADEEQKRRSMERWDIIENQAAAFLPGLATTAKDMIMEQQKAENAKRVANIQAYHARQATIASARETTRQWIDFLKNNKAGMVAVAAGVFASWHGVKIGADMIKRKYEIPELADRDKTSLLPLPTKIYNWITGAKAPQAKLESAVFEPELAQRLKDITDSLKIIVDNGGVLPNILLWGPPGTGKTLVAMLMARSCGMEYIYFSASSLENYSTETGMKLLTDLFRSAADMEKKVVIIIDEAEAVLADRSKPNLSDKTKKFLTHILTYTGTESHDYSVVALTNRPQDLDEAYRSRCDHMIQVKAPAYDQVLDIMRLYVNKYLIEASDLQPAKPSIFTRWLYKPVEPKKVKIEDGALGEDVLVAMAQELAANGFVGRDISKLIVKIRSAAYASKEFTVTRDMVNRVVAITIDEKRKERQGFLREAPGVAAS